MTKIPSVLPPTPITRTAFGTATEGHRQESHGLPPTPLEVIEEWDRIAEAAGNTAQQEKPKGP